jgi:hypothetical protein
MASNEKYPPIHHPSTYPWKQMACNEKYPTHPPIYIPFFLNHILWIYIHHRKVGKERKENSSSSSSSIYLISNRCFHMGHKHMEIEGGPRGVAPFE